MTALRRAVFLDRDGVVVEDVGHLHRSDQLRLLPRAAEAIVALRRAGYVVVVVTNQSVVARGLCSEDELRIIHERLREMLADSGAAYDALYYCPHHPTEGIGAYHARCECRKPAPGMLHAASANHAIDLHRSFLVGDKESDIDAGRAAGCRTVLVRTGHGSDESERLRTAPDHVCETVFDATEWILAL